MSRIDTDDRCGLELHSILEVTPWAIAMAIAIDLDGQRSRGIKRSPLHGVPLIINGNMSTDDSLGMKTSAGAYALKDATATRDAFIVDKARQPGLIIIAKAILPELNGFKDPTIESGSKLKGAILSPYNLKQVRACSSAGSAASVAAGFAPFSLGTDTAGSLGCAASFNALYSLKPSTGFLSRTGILQTSSSFDSPGILAKSAWDIAALMSEMSYVDRDDLATHHARGKMDYTAYLKLDAKWSDFHIGVADKKFFWSTLPSFVEHVEDNEDLEKMFAEGLQVVEEMKRRGAKIMDDAKIWSAEHYKLSEIRDWDLKGTKIHAIEDLVEYNQKHPERSYADGDPRQGFLEGAVALDVDYLDHRDSLDKARKIAFSEGIIATLNEHNLNMLVVPACTEMGVFAAFAYACVATVPLGRYKNGKPYGLSFVARCRDDDLLLQVMDLYEKTFPPRLVPGKMKYARWQRIWAGKALGCFGSSLPDGQCWGDL